MDKNRMLGKWLETLFEWVGEGSLERSIRAELCQQHYPRQNSQILNRRLVAIERPGWVQVFQFEVNTTEPDGTATQLFGVARDDGREKTIVNLFPDSRSRNRKRDEWSQGLITARNLVR